MPVGFVSLFILQHFSVLMCYHDNMITHKTDFVNPHSYIGEISSFVTKSFWASINYLILANYSKVQFYKNSTNSLTLSHLGHSNSFASVQPWSFVVGASCTDFVRPLVSIHAGAECGATPKARTLWLLAKSYKQGRLCQLNRAVARCNGTNS